MKKTLFFALLMMVLAPFAMNAQEPKDMWDFVTSFSTSTGRQHAIAFDGENIYTAAWSKSSDVQSMFYKYDFEGNFIEEFDVPGVTNSDNFLRDMTYDGQYFYGTDANTGIIWCYDLHNKTLVNDHAINTSYTELGTCSYDPQYDAFWVGERAIGSAPFNLDLKLINRSGQVIKTATQYSLPTYGSDNHTVHGTAYFTDENGAAHLYLFTVAGFTAHVFDYNIDTDYLNPNMIFDFSATPGWSFACSAGGAYIGEYQGSTYFFGDVDKSPNLIGIYALGEYTPIVPTPPEGDILVDFEDSMLHWNTIDADDDGHCWEIRQNWGNQENRYSATSASYDDLTQTILFPDNYLVTPYKLDCEQITFIACAQDESRPAEHFGIAIATEDNSSPEDFVMIWEETMTAKSAGNWHSYNIDLREYQGQDIYVAIVHFNCMNQFYLNVDDIVLHRVYDPTVGIAENTISFVSVYPNPTTDVVIVNSDNTVDFYEIYNVSGAMIRREEAGARTFSVDMRELPTGVYFLKMNGETKRIVKK